MERHGSLNVHQVGTRWKKWRVRTPSSHLFESLLHLYVFYHSYTLHSTGDWNVPLILCKYRHVLVPYDASATALNWYCLAQRWKFSIYQIQHDLAFEQAKFTASWSISNTNIQEIWYLNRKYICSYIFLKSKHWALYWPTSTWIVQSLAQEWLIDMSVHAESVHNSN